jgi:hypothetical protein
MKSNAISCLNRVNKKFLVFALLCAIIISSFAVISHQVGAQSAYKTVYVVINVEAESPSGKFLNTTNLHPQMDVSIFSKGSVTPVARVFDQSFRNSITDSYGNPCKLTWFAEMDYLTSQSTFVANGASAGVSGYTAMYDLMKKNWGTELQYFGDAIQYKHSFEFYYLGVWQEFDEGPHPLYPGYANFAIDQSIINNNYYPSAFRAAFELQTNYVYNWVEQYFPFDYTARSLSSGWSLMNPYPALSHYNVQNPYLPYLDTAAEAFAKARDTGNSIYSFYMNPSNDMQTIITGLQSNLRNLAADQNTYPGVTYKYVTAAQAGQLALGYTDFTAPTFTISRNNTLYTIDSNETLWNNSPYIALLYTDGRYEHPAASLVGTNKWTVNIANPTGISKVGVAANDLYGNPGVLVVTQASIPQGPLTPTPTVPQNTPPEVQIPIHAVMASNILDASHTPDRVVNGTEQTWDWWGTMNAKGLPQWITLDMWDLYPINRITTHFYDADSRIYTYYIEVSRDGSTWTNVVAPKIAGGIVIDNFAATMARYFRVTVTGNTVNNASHIEKITAYSPTVVPQPTPTPSPSPSPTPSPSPSPSPTPTASPSPTPTASPSPSPTPVGSPSPTPVGSPSPTPVGSPSPTPTASPSPTPVGSSTPTPTVTVSPSPSPVHTASPSPPVTGQDVFDIALYGIAGAVVIVGSVSAILLIRKKKLKT